jgi:hypothetical protein
MFDRLKDFIKSHQADIILFVGVILISLLSFAMGYITAKNGQKESINFELNESSYFWGGNQWTLSCSKIIKNWQ